MRVQRRLVLGFVALVATVAAGCGGGPSSPSGAQGVVLRGEVAGLGGSSASAMSAGGASDTITVKVLEAPSITATVAADGSFTLRGLPEGSFTLEFSLNGAVVGTLFFDGVNASQELTIVVSVSPSGVTLLEERRNGIGHGDIEIEGLVEQVLALAPEGESRFVIDGHTVVARPGETSIREGNRRRTVSDVTVGRRVHVKGVWLDGTSSSQEVLAHEILLQGPAPVDSGDPGNSFCPGAGGKVEVEGKITAKGGADITVFQQGKGDYVCAVDSGTVIRKGNTNYTFGDLQVGWRVHVKGTSQGGSSGTCNVDASEVKVQQN